MRSNYPLGVCLIGLPGKEIEFLGIFLHKKTYHGKQESGVGVTIELQELREYRLNQVLYLPTENYPNQTPRAGPRVCSVGDRTAPLLPQKFL